MDKGIDVERCRGKVVRCRGRNFVLELERMGLKNRNALANVIGRGRKLNMARQVAKSGKECKYAMGLAEYAEDQNFITGGGMQATKTVSAYTGHCRSGFLVTGKWRKEGTLPVAT